MDWLVPAIIATLSNTVVLSLVYLYLYFKERHPSLFLFFVSWGIYAFRFVFMLLYIYLHQRWMLIANQLFALVSAHMLLVSVRVWLEKRGSPIPWSSASLVVSIWIVGAAFAPLPFTIYTIPSFLYVGIVYIAAGITLIRSRVGSLGGVRIVSSTLIFWGIHKIDYPFLRPAESFAPWGYLIGAAAAVIAAIGMVLIYFDTAKREQNELLREKEILIREVHHRVKNNLSIIDGLLRYHIDALEDTAGREVLQKLGNKIAAFALMHTQLYKSDSVEYIDFGVYVRNLVDRLVATYDEPPETVKVVLRPAEILLNTNHAKNLGLMVIELVSNALKHAGIEGDTKRIGVTLDCSDQERAVLIVDDNGTGIPAEVTFDSPKMSGLYLVRRLCDEIKGNMRIDRSSGTNVRINFALPSMAE